VAGKHLSCKKIFPSFTFKTKLPRKNSGKLFYVSLVTQQQERKMKTSAGSILGQERKSEECAGRQKASHFIITYFLYFVNIKG